MKPARAILLLLAIVKPDAAFYIQAVTCHPVGTREFVVHIIFNAAACVWLVNAARLEILEIFIDQREGFGLGRCVIYVGCDDIGCCSVQRLPVGYEASCCNA